MRHRGRPPGSRGAVRLLVRLACAGMLLVLPATFPLTSAAFSGSTSVDGNSVSALALAPPSDPSVGKTCAPGPGITFVNRTTATGQDAVTVPLPGGTSEHDLLIAQVSHRYALRAITAPSGWTLLHHTHYVDQGVTANAATSAVYWRKATAAEAPSVTFSLAAGTTVPVAGVVAAYRGVHRTAPIDVSAVAGAYGSTVATPGVTTTVPGAVVVRLLTKRQETLPAPAGTSGRWAQASSASGNAWVGASGSDELRATAGVTAPRSSSASTFESEWVAHTVALRPALGAPSAALGWTPSTTSQATGYRVERVVGAGTVERDWTVDPVSASSATDGPLVDGTTYTYRLRTYLGAWSSSIVTVSFTPSC